MCDVRAYGILSSCRRVGEVYRTLVYTSKSHPSTKYLLCKTLSGLGTVHQYTVEVEKIQDTPASYFQQATA